jgi:hypothetical protein
VSLVFDASGSMAGSGNAGAKAAGNAFVDLMDGTDDEAAVIWFNSVVQTQQGMTSYLDLLHSSINALPASGATAVWDGMYQGLIELINNGVNPCRAIICLTDGGDNASSRSPADIISLANRNRIRIFTIGLGTGIQSDILRQIADLTGGRYYETPSPSQLVAVYQEIMTLLRQSFQECIISYDATCMDGGFRRVDLSVVNFCNGTDTKTKTYKAPKDTSTFTTVNLRLADTVGRFNTDIKVPVLLTSLPLNALFYNATFTVQYDAACLTFRDIKTPSGSLLAGVPITITPGANLITFQTQMTKPMLLNVASVPAVLAELTFTGTNTTLVDTTRCPVGLVSWVFEAGCLKPALRNGSVTLLPHGPEITCNAVGSTVLLWNEASRAYVPTPFPAGASFTNIGDQAAQRPRFKIAFDPADFVFVSPPGDSIASLLPALLPAQTESGVWQLAARPRLADKNCSYTVTAYFDNYPPITCNGSLMVPRATTMLGCTLEAPVVTAVDSMQLYVPNPFPVTVKVKNLGIMASDSIRVRLTLPAGMEFAFPDTWVTAEKATAPGTLVPTAEAQAQWMVRVLPSTSDRYLQLRVDVRDGTRPQSICTKNMTIPKILPPLTVTVTNSGPLAFCEGDSVLLDAGAGYALYRWSNSATTRSITVRTSGTYTVTVYDSLSRSVTSAPVVVLVYPAPKPRLQALGSLSLCEGDSVRIDAGAGYASYLWNRGQTTRVITVGSADSWWAVVRTAEGCTGASDTVVTAVWPLPPKPVITRTGDVLSTQAGFVYSWYRDGQLLPGATGATLRAPATGTYRVVAVSTHGCASESADFAVGTLAVEASPPALAWSLSAFPDPSSGSITISATGTAGERIAISIIDAAGRTVAGDCMLGPDPGSTLTLNLQGQPNGLYFVIGHGRGATKVAKFMKVE